MDSSRVFFNGLIDYAGLFPPATLSMQDSVESFASYSAGPDSAALGRFVLPLARIDEFSALAGSVLPRGAATQPWRISLIVPKGEAARARDVALQFNCSHWSESELGHAVCDAIEIPASSADEAGAMLATFPDAFQLFLEIPSGDAMKSTVASLAGTRGAAKIRTGGTVVTAIPRSADIVAFMRACLEHGVSFKATAGLHHPVTGEYSLTYEKDSPVGTMFGYLNVFIAAAFMLAGADDSTAMRVLEERDPAAFAFGDDGVSWAGHSLQSSELQRMRNEFGMSYGSCSFAEPINEARALGLI